MFEMPSLGSSLSFAPLRNSENVQTILPFPRGPTRLGRVGTGDDVGIRLARLESLQEIGQLPSRYAMALDARDLDELVGLFVPDVRVGRTGAGREALKEWFDGSLRNFYRSIHQIVGSTVDLIDPDRAVGASYCRAEHEDANGWFVMALRYDDEFERRDGRWCFLRRRERLWYAVDILERPGPEFVRWPGHEHMRAELPQHFDSWGHFWGDSGSGELATITDHP
jgi:hypothetical protein